MKLTDHDKCNKVVSQYIKNICELCHAFVHFT